MLTFLKFFLVVICTTLARSDIIHSPGLIKREENTDVSLKWYLSTMFDTTTDFNSLYFDRLRDGMTVVSFISGPGGGYCYPTPDACITSNTVVGFKLSSLTDVDASRYRVRIRIPPYNLENSNAAVYIFHSPTKPSISGNIPVQEGQTLTLVCQSSSQSLPEEFQDQAVIEYTWSSQAFVVTSGNSVTVGPLRRADNGDMVTCTANEQGSSLTADNYIILNVTYGPGTISFGSDSDTESVTETSSVRRTCTASCNPGCSFVWINSTSGQVIRHTALLDLGSVDRHDHGLYLCNASNLYGTKSKTFSLQVKFAPDVILTTSNQSQLVQGNSTSLNCDVSSRPTSDIQLYNVSDGTQLVTAGSENTAEYNWSRVDCLQTALYECRATNGIPIPDHVQRSQIRVEIYCAPHTTKFMDSEFNVSLKTNFTYSTRLIANPFPAIDMETWKFLARDWTSHTTRTLPDNVHTSIKPIGHDLMKDLKLDVYDVTEANYGNYTLLIQNTYGLYMVLVELSPEGAPGMPSSPRLLRATAVSLYIEWTAGFYAGRPQIFTVLYSVEGSTEEYSSIVISSPDVSTGDFVQHKLASELIVPETPYILRVKSSNSYNGLSETTGPASTFTTKQRAKFLSAPVITRMNVSSTFIEFSVSGPFTSILVENCVTDTETCTAENVTGLQPEISTRSYGNIPTFNKLSDGSKTKRSTQSVVTSGDQIRTQNSTQSVVTSGDQIRTHSSIHGVVTFNTTVQLADPQAGSFVFKFWLYDGEDRLHSEPSLVSITRKEGLSAGAVAGVVVAVVAVVGLTVAVTVGVILWRRRRLKVGRTQ